MKSFNAFKKLKSAWNLNISRLSLIHLAETISGSNELAVSIIISTRDQATYLALTLASLEMQNLPFKYWEILVVDHSCHSATQDVFSFYLNNSDLQLRVLQTNGHKNVSQVRNQALELARGSIVVFLSDDHVAAPDLLALHLVHHLDEDACVFGDCSRRIVTHVYGSCVGSVLEVPAAPLFTPEDIKDPNSWAEFVFQEGRDYPSVWQYFLERNQPIPNPWIYFDGNNASMRRASLLRIGGFAELNPNWNFGLWGLEYSDIALRLHQIGIEFRFEKHAIAIGQHHPPVLFESKERIDNINCFFLRHPTLSRQDIEPLLMRGA
jgi:glycosyltransferase involved in cell wall biosynthesis